MSRDYLMRASNRFKQYQINPPTRKPHYIILLLNASTLKTIALHLEFNRGGNTVIQETNYDYLHLKNLAYILQTQLKN
jgi:hypothetical protein